MPSIAILGLGVSKPESRWTQSSSTARRSISCAAASRQSRPSLSRGVRSWTMLTDQPIGDLLAQFASAAPTPGGGSASALASALGTSLLIMVASLPRTRSGSSDERAVLANAAEALRPLTERLTGAIDADAAAYDQVVAA